MTYNATPATLASINQIVVPGDTVICNPGNYTGRVTIAPASNGTVGLPITYVGWDTSVFPATTLTKSYITVMGVKFGGLNVSGNYDTIAGCHIAAPTGACRFKMDNAAGCVGNVIRDCNMELVPYGASDTDFLFRVQAESAARVREALFDNNTIHMTLFPNQSTDMKVVMLNRLVGCYFSNNRWTIVDNGPDASNVRQGFLVRDGVVDNTWEGETIRVEAPKGTGCTGIDLTSSGNSIGGHGNAYLNCIIVNEGPAYTQYQWKMQDGDRFIGNRVWSFSGFRISGIDGNAEVRDNEFHNSGFGVSAIIGGSGNWTGMLNFHDNALMPGIFYDNPSPSHVTSDYNNFYGTPVPPNPYGFDKHSVGNL